MAEPSDARAVLTARRAAGGARSLVTLTPSAELARAYRTPGQYVEVRTPHGFDSGGVPMQSSGYFVFGGAVGAPSWELLVRNTGGVSDALTNAAEGTAFDVSVPLGLGFPIERGRGRTLVIAVVGSALAVARPILLQRFAQTMDREGDVAAATYVYVGARSAGEVPIAAEVAGWTRTGVQLVLCLSQPDLDGAPRSPRVDADLATENVRRATGWVQQVLAADLKAGLIPGALVFAAGPPSMLEATRGLALEVITNV